MVTSVMRGINTQQWLWTVVLLIALVAGTTTSTYYYTRLSAYDQMKCTYGERGSLTATCVNASPSYFKTTPYRFDHLDETLRCVNCTLTTIDSGTFDLNGNQIKNLDLHACRIENIRPRGFVGLIFLENLDLSYNHISEIAAGTFAAVKKIKTIDLSYNIIDNLVDDAFAELINLERLILKNNDISTLAPKSFNGLSSLTYLDLTNNSISQIPASVFNNLTRLLTLNLTENNIHTLTGDEFFNLTALLQLDLTGNNINSPVINLTAGNRLKRLILTRNAMDGIKPGNFIALTNLQTLDLRSNQIRDVSLRSFDGIFDLDTLDLSYNSLTTFRTNWFSGLPELEDLNCSHNRIEMVEIVGFSSLNSLYSLDLSYNNLKDVDFSALVARLPKLSYLRLEENPLPCDLEDEMNAYFEEDNFKFVLYGKNTSACEDRPVARYNFDSSSDFFVKQPDHSIRSSEIWVFVFLSIALVLLGVLFFLQWRTYRDLKRGGNSTDLPSAQLIPYHEGEQFRTSAPPALDVI